jgi:hypothetical protein
VEPVERKFKVVQVIPFYYVDETRQLRKIPLPSELNLDENLESWPERFSVEDIVLGEFLAKQMNRRIQALLLADERIRHTIRHVQANFAYRAVAASQLPYFSLSFDVLTKETEQAVRRTIDDVIFDEDALYLFDLILREFTDLVRSYRFNDYDYLELVWKPDGSSSVLRLAPDQLDLFRTRKLHISKLLESPSHSLFTPS